MAEDDNSNLKQALFTVSDAVLGAAILLAAGMYLGSWLDGIFKCPPVLSIVCSLLGGIIGLARMVAKAQALDQGTSPKKKHKEPAKKTSTSEEKNGSTSFVQRSAHEKWTDEQN